MYKQPSIPIRLPAAPLLPHYSWTNPTRWPKRAQVLGLSASLFLALLYLLSGHGQATTGFSLLSRTPKCANDRWANGKWVQRSPPHATIAGAADAYKASGFTGCACNKEPWVQLSNENSTWYQWRSRISTYDWTPGRGCDVAPFDKREFILRMLQKGGWFLIGDETTEQQFFSLSCMLHPHVRAGPSYARWGGWKTSWPQFLYLNVNDKWVQSLLEKRIPVGFHPQFTPLISYHRVDLLFSKPELADVGAWTSHPTADPSKFWGKNEVYTQSALDWLDSFEAKLPGGRYTTLIVSTGAHWLPELFQGLGGGMPDILRLWRIAMELLTARMVAMLDADKSKTRVVLFRSAVQGHEFCADPVNRNLAPLTSPRPLKQNYFNWKSLPQMNDIVDEIVQRHNHPRMHFLRLDRPATLRMDAHVLTDCSRYVVGAGIVEDWNMYMNHFELHEIQRTR